MEFNEVLAKRRSIRKFLSVPVDRGLVGQILSAGNEAPCAGNIQNWRFLIVQDEAQKQKVANAALQQMWIATAPLIIIVCSETTKIKRYYGMRGERLYAIQNCAAAVENMLLKATDLGLGSCWVSAFDETEIAREFSIPEKIRPQAIIPIGYPGEKVPRPMRFTLEDLTYIGTWGGEGKVEFLDAYLRDYHLAEKAIDKGKKLKESSKGFFKRFAEWLNKSLKKK